MSNDQTLPDPKKLLESLGVPCVESNPLITERSSTLAIESLRYDTAEGKVWAFWDQFEVGGSPLTNVNIYTPGGIVTFTLRGEVTMDGFGETGFV